MSTVSRKEMLLYFFMSWHQNLSIFWKKRLILGNYLGMRRVHFKTFNSQWESGHNNLHWNTSFLNMFFFR